MKEKVIELIYIDIESLLDLRQGLMATKNIAFDELLIYLHSREFTERKTDNTKYYKRDEYHRAIRSGDKELLKGSVMTYNITILNDQILRMNLYSGVDDKLRTVEVLFNVYPFSFSEEEVSLIQDAIFANLSAPTKINIVSIPPEDLSPRYIKEASIKTIIMYDYTYWLDKHSKDLSKMNLKDVTLFVPDILFEEFTPEDTAHFKKIGINDPMTMMTVLYSEFIKIEFNPLMFYINRIVAIKINEVYTQMSKDKMTMMRANDPSLDELVKEMVDEHYCE